MGGEMKFFFKEVEELGEKEKKKSKGQGQTLAILQREHLVATGQLKG